MCLSVLLLEEVKHAPLEHMYMYLEADDAFTCMT